MQSQTIKGVGEELRGAVDWRAQLKQGVQHVLRRRPDSSAGVVRVAVDVPELKPISWLRASDSITKTFWRSRDTQHYYAGIGAALALSGHVEDPFLPLKRLEQEILPNSSEGVKAFGGLRFSPGAPVSQEWASHGISTFVVPRFLLEKNQDGCKLVCNLIPVKDSARVNGICNQIDQLFFPVRTHWSLLAFPLTRKDMPAEVEWQQAIRAILNHIESGVTQKIVMARRAVFSFLDRLDPLRILAGLEEVAHTSFRFLFQFKEEEAFLGASPEQLFRRSGRQLLSEAVAGTGTRGTTRFQDRKMGDALLLSEKDQREHAFVKDSIHSSLESITESISIEEKPSLLTLNAGHHLRTRLRAYLKEDVFTRKVIQRLHPTPAVGGTPSREALQAIEELEQFDRGWYAGPVGWLSAEQAEFAVAIRSGLLASNEMMLYSGAGIVEGSKPGEEWDEIEQKLSNFLSILRLTERHVNIESGMG